LSLLQANAIANTAEVILKGGTLETNGFGQDFTTSAAPATLTLSGNSILDLGASNATVNFADSHLNNWSGLLTVKGWSFGRDHLIVGTNSTGLTSAQLSDIQFADFAPGASIIAGEVTPLIGDINQDGRVDVGDIAALEAGLTNPESYAALHPSFTASDMNFILDVNGDGLVTNADLQSLVNDLIDGRDSGSPLPEPSSFGLLALCGMLIAVRHRRDLLPFHSNSFYDCFANCRPHWRTMAMKGLAPMHHLERMVVLLLLAALFPEFVIGADVADSVNDKGAQCTAPDEPSGMKPMFDGKTLDGWDGDPRLWSAKDGIIRGETTNDDATKGNTFLIWKGGEPGDFDLRLSFRLDPHNTGLGNSGVQYRSKHLSTNDRHVRNDWVLSGYQAEIANLPGKDGFLYHERGPSERHRQDGGTPLYLALVGEKVVIDNDGLSHPVGSLGTRDAIGNTYHKSDWNEYVIIARSNHLQHFINGVQTIDVIDNDPKGRAEMGLIGLQIHAGQPMLAEFKNLRIKVYDQSNSAAAVR
jgi:hypothetical protein